MPEAPAALPPPPENPAVEPAASIPVSSIPAPVTPIAPPKPGTARDRMFQDLRKKAGVTAVAPTPATAPSTHPKPPDSAPEKVEGEEEPTPPTPPPEGEETTPEKPPEGEQPTKPTKPDKRPSPWRLVDQYKAKTAELEKQLIEAKANALPEGEVKTIKERAEKAEARARELESHIKFVDYTKSAEFKSKYQEPYEKAWMTAMKELGEIQVIENPDTGEGRPVQPQDLLQLVNLPLGQARAAAREMFGDFADDVMAHRKTIRQLFDSQQTALEEARKSGEEHFKQQTEAVRAAQEKLSAQTKVAWAKANEAAINDEKYGKFFKPVEGDEQGNQRLAKGFELADRAFSENPFQPNLTEEQRMSIIKRHAAVRNRCAAFGRLTYQLEEARKMVARLEKELESYKRSEPGAGAPRATGSSAAARSAKEEVFGALRAKAVAQ